MRSLIFVSLLLAGCSGDSSLYYWGSYEDSVYALCLDFEGKEGLLAYVDALNADVEALHLEDKAPPPGMHAQLGYLEYMAGNVGAAVRNFEAEKQLYPESTVFIDGVLRRIAGS